MWSRITALSPLLNYIRKHPPTWPEIVLMALAVTSGVAFGLSRPELAEAITTELRGVRSEAAFVRVPTRTVAAPITGVVAQVLVSDDDEVEAGQALARFEDGKLQVDVLAGEIGVREALVDDISNRIADDRIRQAAFVEQRSVKDEDGAEKQEEAGPPKLAQARGRLRQARENLAWSTVRADRSGIASLRGLEPGTKFRAGQTMLELKMPQSSWVEVQFPESAVEDLRTGQAVVVGLANYPGRTFNGRLVGLVDEMDRSVRGATVRVELTERLDKVELQEGMAATATVKTWVAPTGPRAGEVLRVVRGR